MKVLAEGAIPCPPCGPSQEGGALPANSHPWLKPILPDPTQSHSIRPDRSGSDPPSLLSYGGHGRGQEIGGWAIRRWAQMGADERRELNLLLDQWPRWPAASMALSSSVKICGHLRIKRVSIPCSSWADPSQSHLIAPNPTGSKIQAIQVDVKGPTEIWNWLLIPSSLRSQRLCGRTSLSRSWKVPTGRKAK